jgi:DNA mismatch endonuclease (patch repair protein)
MVHGCFWHRHRGCQYATTPATNAAFWRDKFLETVKRDRRNLRDLRLLGWRPFVVWECGLNEVRLGRLLDSLRASRRVRA